MPADYGSESTKLREYGEPGKKQGDSPKKLGRRSRTRSFELQMGKGYQRISVDEDDVAVEVVSYVPSGWF